MKKSNLIILGLSALLIAGAVYILYGSNDLEIGAVNTQMANKEIVPSNYIEPRFVDEVALGNVKDYSFIGKFGQNPELNTSTYEDVWDVGGTYSYPANGTAPITKIASSSASDTGTIQVQGLNISGYLVVQEIDLSGTVAVDLDTPLWRVFRLKNEGSVDLVGDVTVTDDGISTIYASIMAGNNQTLMSLYTIPAGKVGLLLGGTNAIGENSRDVEVNGRLLMRPYGGVFQLKKTFTLDTEGTSVGVNDNVVPGFIPSKTDIRIEAKASSAGTAITTTFDIMLVDIE